MIDPKTGQLLEIPLSPIKVHGDKSLEEKELAEKTFRTMLNGASAQDVHLLNGNLAEIFRKLKEGILELPDPNNTGDAYTNLQKLQIAERARKVLEQELFQVKLELKTQSNNFSKTLDTKLQDCQNKLENSQRQNQVLLDQMRQLQIDHDTYKNRTREFHKQELGHGFFYLLDYIASAEISKCGDQEKKLLMYLSTPAEFFITFMTTSKKYEICLQDNLGHGFFICWITLHLLKFQSAAIRKKPH